MSEIYDNNLSFMYSIDDILKFDIRNLSNSSYPIFFLFSLVPK